MTRLLSIPQAAEMLGISPDTLKRWCNHVDRRTGKHAPLIEHIRIGGRGRPNKRLGLTGEIKIHEAIVSRYLDERTFRVAIKPIVNITPKSKSKPEQTPLNSHWPSKDTHLGSREAAEILGIHVATFNMLWKRGDLPPPDPVWLQHGRWWLRKQIQVAARRGDHSL